MIVLQKEKKIVEGCALIRVTSMHPVTGLASSPGPTPKIRKGAWSHLHKFPYVLCQHSSFGVEESCSSITNYQILDM